MPSAAGRNAATPGQRSNCGANDPDLVEVDLRAGLARAGAEGRWQAVEILNEQLRAHLERRGGNVVARRERQGSPTMMPRLLLTAGNVDAREAMSALIAVRTLAYSEEDAGYPTALAKLAWKIADAMAEERAARSRGKRP